MTPVEWRDENQYRCVDCSGAKNLLFLPSGDAALTRRASRISADVRPVVSWNSRRRRWERRGVFVTVEALGGAQAQCALDEGKRAAARRKAQEREAVRDQEYILRFATAVHEEFPGLDQATSLIIATHACEKHSGRVGRSAAAKQLDVELVVRAVIAHARHLHTDYDLLRDAGMNKRESRQVIRSRIKGVLAKWRRIPTELEQSDKLEQSENPFGQPVN